MAQENITAPETFAQPGKIVSTVVILNERDFFDISHDLTIEKSLEHNRNLKMMEKINAVVDWENIEAVLNEHYEVGKSEEGADAFPPLLLIKCMLLQKWFRIP